MRAPTPGAGEEQGSPLVLHSPVYLLDHVVHPGHGDPRFGDCLRALMPVTYFLVGRILPLLAPPTSTSPSPVQGPAAHLGFPGQHERVTWSSSQSRAHGPDSTPPNSSSSLCPPERRDFQKNSLFSSIWSWFLEGGSRASQVPERDVGEGLGTRTRKWHVARGEDTQVLLGSPGGSEEQRNNFLEDQGAASQGTRRRGGSWGPSGYLAPSLQL